MPRAPTREVLSLRAYSALNALNSLRRDGCVLWQSPAVAKVAAVVENKVELLEFRIRDTVDIVKDVGVKKKALVLLLNYNPLWLRIGLETVYGEIIQMHGSANIITLAQVMMVNHLGNSINTVKIYRLICLSFICRRASFKILATGCFI